MKTKISSEKYHELRRLAKDAFPRSEDDWDSARTIEAENKFFDALAPILSLESWEKLEHYCLKATNEERVVAGLGYLETYIHSFGGFPKWENEFGTEFQVPSEISENTELEDISWHHDICPSFCLKNAVGEDDLARIWVNHIDPKQREYEDHLRFFVAKDNDWEGIYTFITDEAEEAIRKLKEISQ